jgi:hypothetical protein
MSKSNGKELVVRDGFAVAMPDEAPALGFDPMADGFSWQDVYPSNYWSEDHIKAKKEALGGWPVLTPDYVALQPVVDPEEKDPDLSPKIVLYFKEAGPALVFNKSRCELATKFAGTSDPRQWAKRLGPIVLMWGDYNKRLQLVFEPAPHEDQPEWTKPPTKGRRNVQEVVDRVNEDLFGK